MEAFSTSDFFNRELTAMHLHEQVYYQTPRGYGDYPLWFNLKVDERQKYRRQADLLLAEAREPRG